MTDPSQPPAEHSDEGPAQPADEDRAEGPDEGRTEGPDNLRAEGSDEGPTEGSDEERAEGSDEERAEGSDEERAEGSDEGRAEGSDEGRTESPEEPRGVDPEESRAHERPALRRRLAIAAGVAALVAFVGWFFLIPYPLGLAEGPVERTAIMEQRIEEAAAEGRELEIRHQWVPLTEISSRVERAVVVAEDYRFRLHEGIDWVSLGEEVEWSGDEEFSWLSPSDIAALFSAVGYVWSHRDELRGRSTITQQLAKNLYFGTDRSLVRKAMEAVVAKRLERHLDKDRILELYLNVAEWGPGVFGVEAAARSYFGVSASSLSLEQAAALAATLPHPLTSNPRTRPGRMAWRKELILDRIDPTRGLPAVPTPIPLPDFDIGLPAPDVPDIGRLDTTVGLDTARPRDTAGAAPADTMMAEDSATATDTTAAVDTTGVRDTTRVGDTISGVDTTSAAAVDTTSGADPDVPRGDPEPGSGSRRTNPSLR